MIRTFKSSIWRLMFMCSTIYLYWEIPLVKVWSLGLVSKHWNTVYNLFCYMIACCHIYFRLHSPHIIIHITCILLSLRRTSAPIHLTSVLGVLGTQETSCILIAGLLERDIFDLFLPEFDKPWVIHLRETCCCSTNLCTWRPNTVYKNRSVRRHQALFWRRCRGGKVKGTHILWLLSYLVAGECSKLFPLDSAILSFCFLFLFSLVNLNGKQRVL